MVERGKHTFCVEEDSGDDSDGSSGIVEVHDLDLSGLDFSFGVQRDHCYVECYLTSSLTL